MKRLRQIGFILLTLTVTSCSGSKERPESVKSPSKSSVMNPSASTAPPSRLCSLFTAAEIKDLLGAPVGEGHVAGQLDSACQWDGSSSDDPPIYAQIQLINDTHYWEKHTGAKGYEALQGIGKEAFVAMSLGGWEAGAVTDKAVVFASVSGASAGRDTAVRLLRDSLARLGLK